MASMSYVIPDILLKVSLNTNQSINQSSYQDGQNGLLPLFFSSQSHVCEQILYYINLIPRFPADINQPLRPPNSRCNTYLFSIYWEKKHLKTINLVIKMDRMGCYHYFFQVSHMFVSVPKDLSSVIWYFKPLKNWIWSQYTFGFKVPYDTVSNCHVRCCHNVPYAFA
jgi:hypothetical protein